MSETLLLVDDEENILRSLKRLFRREGYRILTATSGQEALEILEREPVAVILSDQRMPGMTGSEMLSIAKKKHPSTLRLIMSGYTELESITSAINEGAIFKFLMKPWDDDKLLGHIREAFDIHRLKQTNEELQKQLMAANAELGQRYEETKEESAQWLRSLQVSQEILERIPVAVIGLSDEMMIVTANAAAHELFGTSATPGSMAESVLPENIVEALKALGTPEDKGTVELTQELRGLTMKISIAAFLTRSAGRGYLITAYPEGQQ